MLITPELLRSPVRFMDACLPRRFWDKVTPEPMSGCWLWCGAITDSGYGNFRTGGRGGGRMAYAHRVAFLSSSQIPTGLQLDHRCRTRSCVNPDHLEPVSSRENTMRGSSVAAFIQRNRDRGGRPICKQGHSMSDAIIRPNGFRACRTCTNLRKRANRRARTSQAILEWLGDEAEAPRAGEGE